MCEWINVNYSIPHENGKYLCVVKSFSDYRNIQILGFHNNLKKLDHYDFDKAKPGFYGYDSGYGYSDWTDDVLYWMPLPKLPTEEPNENLI